jgi:hypothetical protein
MIWLPELDRQRLQRTPDVDPLSVEELTRLTGVHMPTARKRSLVPRMARSGRSRAISSISVG